MDKGFIDKIGRLRRGEPFRIRYTSVGVRDGCVRVSPSESPRAVGITFSVLVGLMVFLFLRVRALPAGGDALPYLVGMGFLALLLFVLAAALFSAGRALPGIDTEAGALVGRSGSVRLSDVEFMVQMLYSVQSRSGGGGGFYRAFGVLRDGSMVVLVPRVSVSEPIRVLAYLCEKPLFGLSCTANVELGQEYVGGLHKFLLSGFPTDARRMFAPAISEGGRVDAARIREKAEVLFASEGSV